MWACSQCHGAWWYHDVFTESFVDVARRALSLMELAAHGVDDCLNVELAQDHDNHGTETRLIGDMPHVGPRAETPRTTPRRRRTRWIPFDPLRAARTCLAATLLARAAGINNSDSGVYYGGGFVVDVATLGIGLDAGVNEGSASSGTIGESGVGIGSGAGSVGSSVGVGID